MSEDTGVIEAASPVAETPSAEQVAPADFGAATPAPAGQQSAAVGDTTGQQDGKNIPYDRFSQVVQERNQARDAIAQYEQRLAYMQEQIQQATQRDPVQELLQRLQPQQQEDPYKDPLEAELEATKTQLAEIQKWQQEQVRQAETARYQAFYEDVVKQATSEFSHASPEAIRLALLQNPNPQTALQIAKEAARRSQEDRIAFAKGYKVNTPPPQGVIPSASGGFSFEKPAESWQEAGNRLAYALQNGGKL
jgi:hypothetical protein